MDFDEKRFSKEDFKQHATQLGLVRNDSELEQLLKRTTKNTRTGEEFSFKPVDISIGTHVGVDFVEGVSWSVDPAGPHPHHEGEQQPSSFWIRFREQVRS